MLTSVENIITNIKVDADNLRHIAETGKISGSLLISMREAILQYSNERKGLSSLDLQLIDYDKKHCRVCEELVESRIEAVFSNHKKSPKRLQTLYRYCFKCHAILETNMRLFDTIEEENRQKEFLTDQGVPWIES